MTQYKNVNVNLSENQIQKLEHSIIANCAATSIKLGKNDLEGLSLLIHNLINYKELKNKVKV